MRPTFITSALFSLLILAGAAFATADDEKKQSDDSEAIQPAEVKLDRPVDFHRDIAPIFKANCVACHNKAVHESDVVLESIEGIRTGGASGELLVPKKPADSLLYQVASRDPFLSPMPPLPNDVGAKALTPKQLGLLKQWILEGAKGGDGSAGTSQLAATGRLSTSVSAEVGVIWTGSAPAPVTTVVVSSCENVEDRSSEDTATSLDPKDNEKRLRTKPIPIP